MIFLIKKCILLHSIIYSGLKEKMDGIIRLRINNSSISASGQPQTQVIDHHRHIVLVLVLFESQRANTTIKVRVGGREKERKQSKNWPENEFCGAVKAEDRRSVVIVVGGESVLPRRSLCFSRRNENDLALVLIQIGIATVLVLSCPAAVLLSLRIIVKTEKLNSSKVWFCNWWACSNTWISPFSIFFF